MNQLRTKFNDAEQRAMQASRQLDKVKKEYATVQQLPSTKPTSTRVKKDEGIRSGTPDQQQSKELNDMRARIQALEKDLQISQNELKSKHQAYTKLEQRVKNSEPTKAGMKDGSSSDHEIKVTHLNCRFQ